jgi:serine/threonine protein kinase
MGESNKSEIKWGNEPLESFQKLQTLGTGTFGRVHLIRHKTTGQYFAMKVLKKTEVVRLKQIQHVNSERGTLALLNHPFLVRMYRSYQDSINLYMVMEYIAGGEMFSHLRRLGRFSVDVGRFYLAEVILAIEYIHSFDIIYRDLKPENLLLDQNGHVKITDFGFAKKVEDRTFTLCGTPEYLAPEIIQNKGHGKAVDWWAIGILLFEMLAGYPPFVDDHPFGIYEKILEGKIAFPNHFESNTKDLIKKLLNPDRTRRLGVLKGGAADVKKQKFFKGIDWDKLGSQPGPLLPIVKYEGDTSNFEYYPEPIEDVPDKDDPYGHLFQDF